MKRINWLAVALLLLTGLLAACGDNATPTVSSTQIPATIANATTAAVAPSPTLAATTAAPLTTVATTATVNAVSTQYPVTVTDGAGISLTLTKKPERVLCLHVICIDMLAELGFEPYAIMESGAALAQDPRSFGDKAKNFLKLKPAPNAGIADVETLASLKPDLILGYLVHLATIRDTKIAPLFGQAAIGTYQERIAELKVVAKMLDRSAQAEAAEKRFYERLAAYQAKAPKNISVMITNGGVQDPPQLQIATEKTPTCALFSAVAKCDWKLPEGIPNNGGFLNTSLEKILEYDPDVIIIRSYDETKDRQALANELPNNPFWKELKAFKTKRIYLAPTGGAWGAFGTKMFNIMLDEGLPILYPEVFPKALP
jgi:iron complex transport system substrate-binding protein